MANNRQMTEEIAKSIEALEDAKAETLVKEALEKGLDPVQVLQQGVVAGLKALGRKFEAKEYFLLELMQGAELGKKLVDIITPHLPRIEGVKPARIVLGSTKGDIHDIGKNLVITQLRLSGFEVNDLGVDVPSMTFVDKAREMGADIIGLSAFMSTTMAYFSEVVNYLKDMGLRDKYKVIIGGGTSDAAYAESIGADGWAPDAMEAVKLCEGLMAKKEGATA